MTELQQLSDALPWLKPLLMWIGGLRLAAKPVGAFLQGAMTKLIAAEPRFAWALVRHGAYRSFAFLLDLIASVKLPNQASLESLEANQ